MFPNIFVVNRSQPVIKDPQFYLLQIAFSYTDTWFFLCWKFSLKNIDLICFFVVFFCDNVSSMSLRHAMIIMLLYLHVRTCFIFLQKARNLERKQMPAEPCQRSAADRYVALLRKPTLVSFVSDSNEPAACSILAVDSNTICNPPSRSGQKC